MNEKKFTKEVESNYFRSITYLSLIVGCGLVWYSIFTNGFFHTIVWLIVVSAVFGLWLRLSGRA